MKNFIKIEQDSIANSTNSDVIKFLNFNHQDSDNIDHKLPNEQNYPQFIETLNTLMDIRTTSIKEINIYIQQNYNMTQQQIQKISYGILKKKRILKRIKAKQRKNIPIIKIEPYYPSIETIDETLDQLEKRKKRNRVSAQISRDRKKKQINNLKEQNKKLQLQLQQSKKLNQQLIHQVQSNYQQSNKYKQFTSLLIYLGTMFITTNLQEHFNPSLPIPQTSKQFSQVTLNSIEVYQLFQRLQKYLINQPTLQQSHDLLYKMKQYIQIYKEKEFKIILPKQTYKNLININNPYFN